MAFRRPNSPYPAARVLLGGLKPGRVYTLTDADTGEKTVCESGVLLSQPFFITIANPRESRLLYYSYQ